MLKGQKAKYVLTEWTKEDDKLMLATEKNLHDKVQNFIVKKKLDPTKIDPNRGISALHLAVNGGYLSLVEIFLTQKLDSKIDVKDSQGFTPTHKAASKGNYDILKHLLQQKPNLYAVDRQKRSTLHHACEGGNLGCVQLLLAEPISVHFKDKDGKTALCYAAERGQASICRLLIENGSDVNEADIEGRNPLLWAAMKGHSTVCSYLIQKGAVLDVTDSKGHTAMWYATQNKDNELDHPYEPIGAELGRVEEDDQSKSHAPSHVKRPAPVTPPPRPQRLPPFSGKSTSLLALDGGSAWVAEGTIGEKLGFKSDMLAEKVDLRESDDEAGKRKDHHADLSTDVLARKREDGHDNDADDNQGLRRQSSDHDGSKDLNLTGLNMGSFRVMLDDAFRKSTAEDKEWSEDDAEVHVESISTHETEKAASPKRPPPISIRDVEISLPSVSDGIMRDIETSESSRKSSYAPMSPNSDVSASASAFGELNAEANDIRISLPHFGLADSLGAERAVMKKSSLKSHKSLPSASPVKKSLANKDSDSNYIISDSQVGNSETVDAVVHFAATTGEDTPPVAAISADNDHKKDDEEEKEKKEESKETFVTTYADIVSNKDSENQLLNEHANILEELKAALDIRKAMELERSDLLGRLHVACKSQEWIIKELAEMRITVDELLSSVYEKPTSEGEEERIQTLKHDLKNIRNQLDALLRLEVDDIEEIQVYSLSPTSGAGDDGLESRVARLEMEKYELALKLKEILIENGQLQEQMVEVENLMVKASELKDENEGLMNDYQGYLENNSKESAEVDDLMRLFRETLVENETLKSENQELSGKLDSMTIVTGMGDVDEVKRENVRLMFEKMQLENALLEMTEKLPSNEVSGYKPIKENDYGQGSEDSQDADYKQMYDELKAESVEVLNELRAKEELVAEYNRIVQEYEDLREQNDILKSTLDMKNADVKQLNEQVNSLTNQLEEAFEEFKNAIAGVQEEGREECNKLQSENHQLRTLIQQLNEALEEKETTNEDLALQLSLAKKEKRKSESRERSVSSERNHPKRDSTDEGSQTEHSKDDAKVADKKTHSPVYQDLKNAMLESKRLLQENSQLKKLLAEMENDKSEQSLKVDSELKEDNQKLKSLNEKLQFEIASLKRTIDEQGAYLAYLSPNSQELDRVVFPSDADRAVNVEKELIQPVKLTDSRKHGENKEVAVHVKTDAADAADHSKEAKTHRAEVDKLMKEIIILRSQVECLEQTRAEIDRRNEEDKKLKAADIESLEKLSSEASKKLSEKEVKVLELNETLKEQQKELMASKRLENECDKLIREFKASVQPSGEAYDPNSASLSDRKVFLVELRQWLKHAHEKQSEQEKLVVENGNLVKEVENLKANLKKLESDNEHILGQQTVQEREHKLKFDDLQTILARKTEDVAELKTAFDRLSSEEAVLRVQLDEMRAQLKTKDNEIRFTDAKREAELNLLISENSDLKSQLNAKQIQMSEEYEEQLLDQIENLTVQATNLQKQLSDKTEEINQLRGEMSRQIDQLRFAIDSYQEKDLKNSSAAEERDRLREENLSLSKNKKTMQKEHEKEILVLKAEMDSQKKSNSDSLLQLNDMAVCRSQLEERCSKVEGSLKRLEQDLRNVTAEKEKAVAKITDLEKCCREMEDSNKQLRETCGKLSGSNNQAESNRKVINQLQEVNLSMQEKMNSIEQENQKLALEKEQAELLLEMEKLKNLSITAEGASITRSSHNGHNSLTKSSQHTATHQRQNLISISPVRKPQYLSDFNGFNHSLMDSPDSSDTMDVNARLAEENRLLRRTLDQIEYGFCQPTRMKSEGTQTPTEAGVRLSGESQDLVTAALPTALVAENRRLFLDIGNLQSSLRRRSSIVVHNEVSSPFRSPKPLEQQRQDSVKAERNFIDEVASKSLEHLSVLITLEEEADRVWKDDSNHNRARQESSVLISKLKMHNASLKQLRSLLQSVVDNEIFYDAALHALQSHGPVFPENSANRGSSSSQRPHSNSLDINGNKNDESSKLLVQLQQQLMENERKYKDIIQKYRRHLVCAVQGQMDPEVKESLLNFIEAKKSESRK